MITSVLWHTIEAKAPLLAEPRTMETNAAHCTAPSYSPTSSPFDKRTVIRASRLAALEMMPAICFFYSQNEHPLAAKSPQPRISDPQTPRANLANGPGSEQQVLMQEIRALGVFPNHSSLQGVARIMLASIRHPWHGHKHRLATHNAFCFTAVVAALQTSHVLPPYRPRCNGGPTVGNRKTNLAWAWATSPRRPSKSSFGCFVRAY